MLFRSRRSFPEECVTHTLFSFRRFSEINIWEESKVSLRRNVQADNVCQPHRRSEAGHRRSFLKRILFQSLIRIITLIYSQCPPVHCSCHHRRKRKHLWLLQNRPFERNVGGGCPTPPLKANAVILDNKVCLNTHIAQLKFYAERRKRSMQMLFAGP